jgi:hypothetical protein
MSPIWIQLQLQSFLAAGYAVVLTTMIADDSYMYQETCLKSDDDNIYNLCWNKGNNPDALYLSALFKLIHDKKLLNNSHVESLPADNTLGTLDPKVKNFLKTPIHLNHLNCGLIGYSVGAQMVSRAINNFGTKNNDNIPYSPQVSVGCMISGGSLHCYEYCNGDTSTLRGYDKNGQKNDICLQQPNDWGPCWNPKDLGCCPANLTEPRYDDKSSTESHPPVIMVQTDFDYFADPRASENYYKALKKKTPKVDVEIVHGLCGNHNLFPSAILPVLSFFKKHMSHTNYSSI